MLFVERADGAFERLLRHFETFGDGFRLTAVGEGQEASRFAQCIEEHVGKIAETPFADALQTDVEAAVGAQLHDRSFQHLPAARQTVVGFARIDEAGVGIVHDHLHAQGRTLPSQELNRAPTVVIARRCGTEIAIHLGRGRKAPRRFVNVDVNHVVLAHFHRAALFAERNKEVFHHAPREKRSVLVDPCHFQAGKVAHLCQRTFGSGHQALALVEIDKQTLRVSGSPFGTNVGFGDENFAHVPAVDVSAVVGEASEGEGVETADLKHGGQGS